MLTEPDNHSKLASLAYLREFVDWRPDLLVLINYTRRQLGGAVPPEVPFVCWVQDRMPHLANPELGAAHGELDFLAGCCPPDLFNLFGYPASRSAYAPVPACEEKFHAGPVAPPLARAHGCEVAYVSHQSEPPEASLERLLAQFQPQPSVQRAFRLAFDAVVRAVGGDTPCTLRSGLDLPGVFREAGITNPDPRMVSSFMGLGLIPLGERVYRHATLRWAADLCERRGWRLHLYGRGWERHPTLHRFARGPLEHDEELRAVYRSARAHLHASITTNAHQRVAECALSGGLMLRRGPSPDYEPVRQNLSRLIAERFAPTRVLENSDWIVEAALPGGHEDWSAPDPVRARRMRGAAPPAPNPDGTYTLEWRVPAVWRASAFAQTPRIDLGQFPDYAFPDAHESMFSTPQELEASLGRAVEDDAWRERAIAGHRRQAMAKMTVSAFVDRMLAFVRTGLSR